MGGRVAGGAVHKMSLPCCYVYSFFDIGALCGWLKIVACFIPISGLFHAIITNPRSIDKVSFCFQSLISSQPMFNIIPANREAICCCELWKLLCRSYICEVLHSLHFSLAKSCSCHEKFQRHIHKLLFACANFHPRILCLLCCAQALNENEGIKKTLIALGFIDFRNSI